MSREIGSVRFEMGGVRRLAILGDDGKWSIDPPIVGDAGLFVSSFLDGLTRDYGGPADGPFGPRQVDVAARFLRGTPDLMPTRPAPPGTIY